MMPTRKGPSIQLSEIFSLKSFIIIDSNLPETLSPIAQLAAKEAQIDRLLEIIQTLIIYHADTSLPSIENQPKVQRLIKIDNPPKLNNKINPTFDN